MTEHSPEPWTYHADCRDAILSADQNEIFWGAKLKGPYAIVKVRPEDARRIVACVNACRGIPTEVLEDQARLTAAMKFPFASVNYCRSVLEADGYKVSDPHDD